MKITKVEVFRLPTANSKQNSPIGCRIHTDVGICGDGEAGMAYGVGGSGAFGMVCDLAELIIGMDPLRTEFIWETMYKRTFWGQVGVSEHLWAVTPADYAHNVKLALDEGFDAIKIDFFDRDEEGKPLNFLDTTGLLTPKQLKMVESRMKAAREAAGDDVDIREPLLPGCTGSCAAGKAGRKV